MHYKDTNCDQLLNTLQDTVNKKYYSCFGGTGDGAFSFGLILTPRNLDFTLFGFEDEDGGSEGDEASLRSDGGGLSGNVALGGLGL